MLTGLPLILLIAAALVWIVIACALLRWHPFPVLLVTAIVLGLTVGLSPEATIATVGRGGADVFGSIGLIIALGTLLGTILEKTGAAQAIAVWILHKAGKKRVLPGMSLLGAVAGIPVFCDSGFIILSNLGKSLAARSRLPFGAVSIALATGLYTAHVLIPPTPGPLAAAGNLGMNEGLGWIILLGLVVSIPALLSGYWFARRFARREPTGYHEPVAEESVGHPGIFSSLLPLLLPVVLIGGGSVLTMVQPEGPVRNTILFFCNPTIAILLGAGCALILLGRPYRKDWSNWIQTSLAQAGPIIFITIAGGALGAVLKATPLSVVFQAWTERSDFSLLWLYVMAFLIAAGLKTAQGSSTASLVISSSIIAPLLIGLPPLDDVQKALLVLTIGAGAMTVSHANDSYFWVINQYAGIDTPRMYRYFTRATLVMGIATLLSCLLLVALL